MQIHFKRVGKPVNSTGNDGDWAQVGESVKALTYYVRESGKWVIPTPPDAPVQPPPVRPESTSEKDYKKQVAEYKTAKEAYDALMVATMSPYASADPGLIWNDIAPQSLGKAENVWGIKTFISAPPAGAIIIDTANLRVL